MVKRGCFIVFEGIDGAGKTVQAQRLAASLRERGYDVIVTCEPTDGYYRQEIAKLLKDGRDTIPIERETELFTEDRRHHVEELIAPALDAGKVVLCDRYYYSTMAYQGAAGGDVDQIRRDNEAFAPAPDLVFLIEIPVHTALERIGNSGREGYSAFEREEYLHKVDALFRSFQDPSILRLSGTREPVELSEEILTETLRVLETP